MTGEMGASPGGGERPPGFPQLPRCDHLLPPRPQWLPPTPTPSRLPAGPALNHFCATEINWQEAKQVIASNPRASFYSRGGEERRVPSTHPPRWLLGQSLAKHVYSEVSPTTELNRILLPPRRCAQDCSFWGAKILWNSIGLNTCRGIRQIARWELKGFPPGTAATILFVSSREIPRALGAAHLFRR